MPQTSLHRLSADLRADLPPELGSLRDDELVILHKAFTEARQQQAQEMDEALTKALEHVPAMMRGPVRKILGL